MFEERGWSRRKNAGLQPEGEEMRKWGLLLKVQSLGWLVCLSALVGGRKPLQRQCLHWHKFWAPTTDGRGFAEHPWWPQRAAPEQIRAGRAFSRLHSPPAPRVLASDTWKEHQSYDGRRLPYLYCDCPPSTFLENNFKASHPTMKTCEWSVMSFQK